jgi:hypothetical protein
MDGADHRHETEAAGAEEHDRGMRPDPPIHLLRRAVRWRKTACGCSNSEGCQFVERILTTVQTLALQGRQLPSFPRDSLVAHRAGLAIPKLVLEG